MKNWLKLILVLCKYNLGSNKCLHNRHQYGINILISSLNMLRRFCQFNIVYDASTDICQCNDNLILPASKVVLLKRWAIRGKI